MFKPGQKVVCVDDSPTKGRMESPPLVRGRVYVVKGPCVRYGAKGVLIEGVPGWMVSRRDGSIRQDARIGWRATRFASIDPKPESLEVFTRMLKTAPVPMEAL